MLTGKNKNTTEPKLCDSHHATLQQSRNPPARAEYIFPVDVILEVMGSRKYIVSC